MLNKKILIIEPHSDDSIIAAGGYLSRLKDENQLFFCLVCASDLEMHHGNISRATRLSEYHEYIEHYSGENTSDKSEGDYSLPLDAESRLDQIPRAKLVNLLEKVIYRIKPDVLFIMGPSFHHDHTIVYEACIAATRPTFSYTPELILVMENPTYVHDPYPPGFMPNYYVNLTASEMDRKCDNFEKLFPSQIRKAGNYLSREGIKKWAAYRGIEARTEYAEAFHVYFQRV